MAYSGPIPTFQVSSNSLINNIIGGLINNATGSAVNVALSSSLGQQVTSSLGLGVTETPGNIVSSILTPGLLSTGSQTISDALTSSIIRSNALGPGGPLVAGLATQALGNLTGGLIQGLVTNQSGPSKFFPGAGDEGEDANYGNRAYGGGQAGKDVVFSIQLAQNSASSQVQGDITGNNPGSVFSDVSVDNLIADVSYKTELLSPNSLSGLSDGSQDLLRELVLYQENYWEVPYLKITENLLSDTTSPDPSSPSSLAATGEILRRSQDSIAGGSTNSAGTENSAPGTENSAPAGWKFTTTPGDITWDTSAKVDRVPIFGTNKPPVISGSRGMRDLSMSNALIEGFSIGKSVESKIASLESLLDFSLNKEFVNVPVYWITASDKKYGEGFGDGGYFVIKQIKVKEELRDLSGRTTRAMVDVAFSQVPSYQVDDGRDIASKSVAGGKSILSAVSDQVDKNFKEQQAKLAAQAQVPATNPTGATGVRQSQSQRVDALAAQVSNLEKRLAALGGPPTR